MRLPKLLLFLVLPAIIWNASLYSIEPSPSPKKLSPTVRHSDEQIELTQFLDNKDPYDSNNPWFYPPGFKVIANTEETHRLEEQYLHFFKIISKEKSRTTELRWSLLQFL